MKLNIVRHASTFLRSKLSKNLYNQIKSFWNIFTNLTNLRYLFYDKSYDLKHNEDFFNKLQIEVNKIKELLHNNNYDYFEESLSWHYHLFSGLKYYFQNQNYKIKKILEIGTFDGKFTSFIAKIFPDAEITTIDLDREDERFKNSYERETDSKLRNFIQIRQKNLNIQNINLIAMDSINIYKRFKEKKFDLIWVDGDHLNPQVSIDLLNSLNLMDDNGVMCVDDVIKNLKFKKNSYVSNDSYITLNHLEKAGLIKNYYIVKRVSKSNLKQKKYISISFKK